MRRLEPGRSYKLPRSLRQLIEDNAWVGPSYPNIIKSLTWLKDEGGRVGPSHPLVFMLRASDEIRESDSEYRNPDLADLESDLAELQGTPGISRVFSKMRNPTEFFDERVSLWFAAKYKRRGWCVDLIPETSNTETPDLSLLDPKTGLRVIMEVKHIDLKGACDFGYPSDTRDEFSLQRRPCD